MKPKRLVLVFAPFACILLYAFWAKNVHQEIPRAKVVGAQLTITTLAAGEEIVVEQFFAHRNVIARKYRFEMLEEEADQSPAQRSR